MTLKHYYHRLVTNKLILSNTYTLFKLKKRSAYLEQENKVEETFSEQLEQKIN